MQIFELTQKRKLNEYDPSRPPPKKNFGAGVGPGVQPQYTATPRMKATPTPGPVPQLPPPAATTTAMTAAAPAPKLQTIAAPPQLTAPTAAKQIGTNYDPNVIDVDAKEKSANTTAALSPPAPAPQPAPQPAPTSQPAPAPQPAPQPAPATGIDPELAAASKVKMGAPQGRKANIGGAIANAMQAYNANKVGLGYLLPKDAKNEVYTDSTGKITIDGVPYNAANPEHQRLVGKITIGGKPYNGANPEHQAAYLAFKNTAGRGGSDTVKIDANGKVTVLGQPFDPANPAHVQAYRRHVLASSVAQTPPPAPQQPPAAQQPPATATGSSDVKDALLGLGYTVQQAAALAAKVPPGTSTEDALRQILQGKITESLSWSRDFDPSSTLLKKIKQL